MSSTFGFDSAGNRTGVNSTTIPFNNDNQCSSTGYSFDGNGNPTSYNGTSLSFDPENRVSAIGSLNSATYRADGLRASKTVGTATTYYLYDNGKPIIELNSSGTVTALNVFAPDGLVARQTGSTTIEYVMDQQGNVADRTDTSGNVLSITQYGAWGNEQAISGTPTDPFGYNAQSGYYLDRETGLYLCQHRLYDPANGRWLNRDPIGFDGGTNLYGYCAGGPMNDGDGSGYKAAWVRAWEAVAAPFRFIGTSMGSAGAKLIKWWNGEDLTGPEGEPVRVGGWPRQIWARHVAFTINGTVHIDPDDVNIYMNNPWWRHHEQRHIWQQENMFGGHTIPYAITQLGGWVLGCGHDGSPWEIDANNAAGSAYQDPLGSGVFGLLSGLPPGDGFDDEGAPFQRSP